MRTLREFRAFAEQYGYRDAWHWILTDTQRALLVGLAALLVLVAIYSVALLLVADAADTGLWR